MLIFLALACRPAADPSVPTAPATAPEPTTQEPPTPVQTGTQPTQDSPTDSATTSAGSSIRPGVDPGPPAFPAVVDTLSVTVVTGDTANDGTDDTVYLCLEPVADPARDCLPLERPDVDDHQRGETHVYHFEGLGLPRSQVSQVSLHIRDGGNAWSPRCMAMQFDGEPVYCHDNLGFTMGDAGSEVLDWVDPSGLQLGCDTCFDAPLTHGPMVGAVAPERARIVVRTDATRQVALYVSETPDLGDAVIADYGYPSPTNDFTATLVAEGTTPSTGYWYAVGVDGQPPTAAGHFTTPRPVGEPGTMRLAMGSCAKSDTQPIFTTIAAAEPDLFLFLGDNHYGNTGDLDALRWNYRWAWERAARADFATRTPVIATWDDHDFIDNNSYGADHDEWPAEERDHALRAFTEYWGNPSAGTATTPGVFFRHAIGDVELFVLDGRYHRDDAEDVAVPAFLGDEQLTWLLDALAASDATFKILANGSMWSPNGSDDSWAVYPQEWDELFSGIAARGVEGVVLASGDVHRSEFRLVDNPHGYDLPEFIASSLAYTTPNPCLFNDDDVIACRGSSFYFTALDIDTTAADPTITATIVDRNGNAQATWTVSRSQLTY